MTRNPPWKIFSVVLVCVLAGLLIVPSLLSKETVAQLQRSLPSWLPVRQIVLGLDLQGGAHLLLEVDSASVTRSQVETLRDDVRRIARDENIPLAGGISMQPRGVQFRVADAAARTRMLPRLQALSQPAGGAMGAAGTQPTVIINQGPDGLIQIGVTDSGVNDRVRRAVDQTIEVLRRRVDATGTVEPNIQRQGADRVVVDVPGLQDTDTLKSLLGTTAKLEFRLVSDAGANPGDYETLPYQEGGGTINVERRVMVQGEDLVDAQPGFDQRTNEPVVNFRFNIRGGQRFGEVTAANVGRPFAIVLDEKVISAPRIISPITGGSGQISGNFTVEQANNLSILLRAGALPAKLTIVEERTVGPGLGQDSIDAGRLATYVAAALVTGYMLITYGIFGIFANIALLVHVAMVFASLILLKGTLTLPGIAGIVFTIGMAVDSNVLIYERIREEHKAGRSIIAALDTGFNRAFTTIIDSNVTMFVAAMLLYFVGSGPVRGFALTLMLGVATTVITAVTMTRMMIAGWYRVRRPTKLPI